MNKEQQKARDYAIKQVMASFPTLDAEQAGKMQDKLHVLGCKAKRNATALCNGDVDQYEYDMAQVSIAASINKLLTKYGVSMKYNLGGDPRGYCLKVHLPNGASNTWGGREDGFGFGE